LYDFHLWGTKGKIEIVNFGTELKLYKIKKSLNFQGFQELKLVSCTKFTESYLENTYQEFVNFFKDRKLLSTSLTDSINAMETFERYVYVKNMLK
jgi:hypothetical protein